MERIVKNVPTIFLKDGDYELNFKELINILDDFEFNDELYVEYSKDIIDYLVFKNIFKYKKNLNKNILTKISEETYSKFRSEINNIFYENS